MCFFQDDFGNLINLELIKAIVKEKGQGRNEYWVSAFYSCKESMIIGRFNSKEKADIYFNHIQAMLSKINALTD